MKSEVTFSIKITYSTRMKKREAQQISDKLVEALRFVRESKNISRYRVSKLTGISESSVKYIEECRQRPTFYILQMIAEAIGIDIVDAILLSRKLGSEPLLPIAEDHRPEN